MKCSKCLLSFKETASVFECRKCRVFPFIHKKIENKTFNVSFPEYLKLTPQQNKISADLIECAKLGHVCVEAVCGAGKTEICIPLIIESLNQGQCVGWSIPRVEIVKQLSERLRGYFPTLEIVCLHGDATEITEGDVIVLTTHQLHRYIQYFDLLIIDEPDAFPYFNDPILESEAMRSSCGTVVYLSATYKRSDCQSLYLPVRPSEILLVVPRVVKSVVLLLNLVVTLKKLKTGRILIFVPTKKDAFLLSSILGIQSVTSETKNKQRIFDSFKAEKRMLICTSVLERGVTFDECHVVVYHADHEIYDSSTLIQISGRAMRGMNPKPTEVVFLCYSESKSITNCILRIVKCNRDAMSVLNKEK